MFTLNNDIQALILDNDSCFGWSIGDQLHNAQKARQAKGVEAMIPFYQIAGLKDDGMDEHGHAMDFPALAYANFLAGPENYDRFEKQVFDLARPFEESGYTQWIVREPQVIENMEWLVLNGVKLAIYTSGTARHTKAVMRAKGVDHLFGDDNIYDIVRTAPDFKPSREAYVKVCAGLGVDPARTVMIDDGAKHLEEARKLGAQTVLFDQFDRFGKPEQHAPHDRVTSINDFIEDLATAINNLRGPKRRTIPTASKQSGQQHG